MLSEIKSKINRSSIHEDPFEVVQADLKATKDFAVTNIVSSCLY